MSLCGFKPRQQRISSVSLVSILNLLSLKLNKNNVFNTGIMPPRNCLQLSIVLVDWLRFGVESNMSTGTLRLP